MSNKLKRLAVITGGVALLSLGLGKYFDSQCVSSCLMAANTHGGSFNLTVGDGFFSVSDDDEGGSDSVSTLRAVTLPDVADLQELVIRVVSTDLKIIAADKLAARAVDYRTDKGWAIRSNGKELLLDLRDKGPGRLELDLPPSFKGRLELTTVSGDVQVGENLAINQMKIHSTSGHTDLASWPKDEFSISTVSGDLSSSAQGPAPKVIDIEGVSADIDIQLGSPFQTFRTKTVSGDVSVRLRGKAEFDYSLHSISGDFRGIPGSVTKEGVANRQMDGRVGEPKDSRFEFESISGDFKMTL